MAVQNQGAKDTLFTLAPFPARARHHDSLVDHLFDPDS